MVEPSPHYAAALPVPRLRNRRPMKVERNIRMIDERERNLETLNHLLVDTFNAILKVEERSIRVGLPEAVTVTEMHILDAIGDDGVPTVTELAAAAMVTVSTMTIAVNRLEGKQLVEKLRDTVDRRVVRVRLTEAGQRIAYLHRRFHRRMARSVADGLEPEELHILARAMENLQTFFRQESHRLPLETEE